MDSEVQALKDQVQLLSVVVATLLISNAHEANAQDKLQALLAGMDATRAAALKQWASGWLQEPQGDFGSFPGL